ncbi:MAG: SsrA-binding protein SmpB, partial [Nitrospinaceae bacterium]|nr:SsrA-binding protein SmpB [Nitrospinaceae bacterium]NIR57264.1 SsrA-binding protein SmpB [Nitrospinaceae bacterium]NIS87712.1 SsrA-binding protein SmpB [Nitrospinaceae bacterium]NIT84578.1 SsrA-binding protein SmpB [Nitrospinaceae bacterium]NIU46764.1 SsrA-binding protein SmpB [Nitrospinaceae bacterium]
YHIEDTLEAGVVLQGTEVKALREGKASMVDCYAVVEHEEVFMVHCHISPYTPAHSFNHDPMRRRKLLLHKREISRLIGVSQEKGHSLIPLKLYFKNGRVKVELAIAKGKKTHDKRETLKKREADREIARAMKRDKP